MILQRTCTAAKVSNVLQTNHDERLIFSAQFVQMIQNHFFWQLVNMFAATCLG